MSGTLAVRRAPAPARGAAAPLVPPERADLPPAGRPRIYLAALPTRTDRNILCATLAAEGLPAPRWLPASSGSVDAVTLRHAFLAGEPVLVPLAPPRAGEDRLGVLLGWAADAAAEVDLIPAEVLWGPSHVPSLWNLLLGNPYDPPRATRWLQRRRRGRVRVILGAPGLRSALSSEAQQASPAALAGYVRGQAVKALSLTERQVFGDRYKVPRFVVEQILGEPEFQARAEAAGTTSGLAREASLAQAERGLRELATGHNLFYMEVFRRFVRWLYTRSYESEIDVAAADLERLRQLGRRSALIFIPSHKSNFDHMVLYYTLFSAGFPPPHTATGINMSFFPMSRILPGTGAYFIRRSFQNDPVYKECLRAFIDYLVRRRFHQEFFIEGGRSRSGKLLPPRYGMLRYVVEGARTSHQAEVYFVPTTIAYDQLLEVDEYVRQQLGDEKVPESFRFLVRQIALARRRRLGRVYIRFGEPISLRGHLKQAGDDRLVVEKLAFQISNRINAGTPLTAVATVCSVLLGAGRRAMTRAELESETSNTIDYVRERGLLLAPEVAAGAASTVRAAVTALEPAGVIGVYDEGAEPVYYVTESGRHAACWYRNTVIHFPLRRAIALLAERGAQSGGSVSSWALRLRELLKFEFFFSERETFLREIERESQRIERERRDGVAPLLAAGPHILLDFMESYLVVARTLETQGDAPVSRDELLSRCQAMGRQLLLQDRVQSRELLSNVNFANALELAVNLRALRRTDTGYAPGSKEALAALARDVETLSRLARTERGGSSDTGSPPSP